MKLAPFIILTSLGLFIFASVLSTIGEKFDLYAGVLLILSGMTALLGGKLVAKYLELLGKNSPKAAAFLFSTSTVWYWGIAVVVLGVVQVGVSAN